MAKHNSRLQPAIFCIPQLHICRSYLLIFSAVLDRPLSPEERRPMGKPFAMIDPFIEHRHPCTCGLEPAVGESIYLVYAVWSILSNAFPASSIMQFTVERVINLSPSDWSSRCSELIIVRDLSRHFPHRLTASRVRAPSGRFFRQQKTIPIDQRVNVCAYRQSGEKLVYRVLY